MRSNFRTIVLTGLLATAGFGTAFAQTAALQPAPAAGAQAEQRGPGGPGRFDPAKREAHMQKRLAETKAKLRITPQQEGAWTTYTAAIRPPQRDAGAPRFDRAEFAKLTTPQRIDRMREMRARHQAEADQRGDAVKTFYAALTPAQQQTFDALPMHSMGPHARGHRGGDDHGPRGARPTSGGGEGPAR